MYILSLCVFRILASFFLFFHLQSAKLLNLSAVDETESVLVKPPIKMKLIHKSEANVAGVDVFVSLHFYFPLSIFLLISQ